MPLTEIALTTIAAALCILVLALIPTLLTIKRAAESVGELADMVNDELRPTLQELTAVLAELRTVGGGVAEHSDDVLRFMAALGDTGTNLNTINKTVGAVTKALNNTSVWVTGAKVAGMYILERYQKKRGGV